MGRWREHEIIANNIHQRSRRADKTILSLNCGATPETLLDSEWFGYEHGAFTGATNLKRGHFEQAHGGTVFLCRGEPLSFGGLSPAPIKKS